MSQRFASFPFLPLYLPKQPPIHVVAFVLRGWKIIVSVIVFWIGEKQLNVIFPSSHIHSLE